MDLPGVEHVAMPRSRAELPSWTAGTAVLAGGTWIFSEPQPGISRLVDLAGFDWPPLMASAVDAGATKMTRAIWKPASSAKRV